MSEIVKNIKYFCSRETYLYRTQIVEKLVYFQRIMQKREFITSDIIYICIYMTVANNQKSWNIPASKTLYIMSYSAIYMWCDNK